MVSPGRACLVYREKQELAEEQQRNFAALLFVCAILYIIVLLTRSQDSIEGGIE